MRKKIVGMSVIIALLAILCAQSVIAQAGLTVDIWTDKSQYKPGEKGTLKISMLNEGNEPLEIRNITIVYPWFAYDAEAGKWVGNETIKLEPAELLVSQGGKYYKPVEFTVPTDGRVTGYPLGGGDVDISIGTSKGIRFESVELLISSVSLSMAVAGLDTWMTSLIVAAVVCTVILALVVLMAVRSKTRVPSALPSRVPAPPKAKAE